MVFTLNYCEKTMLLNFRFIIKKKYHLLKLKPHHFVHSGVNQKES